METVWRGCDNSSISDEIVLNSDTLPGVFEIREAYNAGWISRAKPDNTAVVDLLAFV